MYVCAYPESLKCKKNYSFHQWINTSPLSTILALGFSTKIYSHLHFLEAFCHFLLQMGLYFLSCSLFHDQLLWLLIYKCTHSLNEFISLTPHLVSLLKLLTPTGLTFLSLSLSPSLTVSTYLGVLPIKTGLYCVPQILIILCLHKYINNTSKEKILIFENTAQFYLWVRT